MPDVPAGGPLTCNLPGCRWTLDVPPVEVDPQREERRRAEVEREATRHVNSHPQVAWCRALAAAQAELIELRGRT